MAEDYDDQSPFLYAHNNPVRFTDYLGMGAQDEVDKDKDKKKKDEEAKKKEEEKKKKEFEDRTGKLYYGLNPDDEDAIEQMIIGSPGRLVKVGKAVAGAIRMIQWGWKGTATWKQLVKTVKSGGDITSLFNKIPTKKEAIDLIKESGGKVLRIEKAGEHSFPNPHTYSHINYQTPSGGRGTIKIKD